MAIPQIPLTRLFVPIRFFILIFFIIFVCYHTKNYKIQFYPEKKHSNYSLETNDSYDFNNPHPNQKYLEWNQQLPLLKGTATDAEIEWATEFLRLPTWSSGFTRCNSEASEISCYELYRAAQYIRNWTENVKNKNTIGNIFVKLNPKIQFGDKLSMIYHGFQIAVTTNRTFLVNKSEIAPFSLPDSVIHFNDTEFQGELLQSNQFFPCVDVSSNHPNIYFDSPSWPQALYTNPMIAPILREKFGIHSAFYIGNYLFGDKNTPENSCYFSSPTTVVEGFAFKVKEALGVDRFETKLHRCGITPKSSVLVTNDQDFNLTLFKENEIAQFYTDVQIYDDKNGQEFLCSIRKLTSGKKIVQTFGSRMGFWATALQGSKASFVNVIDQICTNMTNSQQGSIWHTFASESMSSLAYVVNEKFIFCGNNLNDVLLYNQYLLW